MKLPNLSPDLALGELCKRSFYRFFLEMWETIETVELVPNWHIKYICDELQDVYETWEAGEVQDDVLINVPPGSSKSTIITQTFPAWLWVRDASIRVISSSYSGDLATAHAVKTRDMLKSDKFNRMYPNLITFKSDTDGKTHYKNTDNGERFVTSTGGRVTGMHGDFIISDDPINPEATASEKELTKAVRFQGATLSTRKTNKARTVTIMVMQRLHHNDPAGDWIRRKGDNLRHICLPGEVSKFVKPEELKDRYVDGLLDPIRMDRKALDKIKSDLGSYGYAGQIGQQPSPEDGEIWKSNWIIPVPDHEMPSRTEMRDYGTDWDTAYTKNEKNAASAYIVSGKKDNKMYIDALGWEYMEFPELLKFMKTQVPSPHYVEKKASGKSACQTLISEGIPAVEVDVNGDKTARARDATPKAEGGLVYCRASILEKLLNDTQQGILAFPNGEKQDLADTLAQAIMRHYPNAINKQQAPTGSLGSAMRGMR